MLHGGDGELIVAVFPVVATSIWPRGRGRTGGEGGGTHGAEEGGAPVR